MMGSAPLEDGEETRAPTRGRGEKGAVCSQKEGLRQAAEYAGTLTRDFKPPEP